ncbi:molybdate ABC transporter substrate-binding protein [Glaciecola petra]|uniref:Molybdate ABC transporter substrate-binding protein n=1 Tax=Glaciecola petra TaxID=3075602 RepID=A0ABU2ZQM2_9ALTE|nr:molybdate ABC transporter substrate-binding protein [Aestuariibacter sp. P117]MDT0594695.1 molybdate ABC transporter substrate-binding protein [Aestuariibacter sp. P117]
MRCCSKSTQYNRRFRLSARYQYYWVLLSLLYCSLTSTVFAQDKQITVAVASNFRYALEALLAERPKEQIWRAEDIKIVTGSSGLLYAQIIKGAPFDVFMSADTHRPRLLEQANLTLMRHTYAYGQLVLWRSEPLLPQTKDMAFSIDVLDRLIGSEEGKIAIAKPDLAPYGLAAYEILTQSELFSTAEKRLVFGTNVTQAFQFVDSGNAQFGILSKSLLVQASNLLKGDKYKVYYSIPQVYYKPIEQQLVVLERSKNKDVVRSFVQFLLSPSVQMKLQKYGYKHNKNINSIQTGK